MMCVMHSSKPKLTSREVAARFNVARSTVTRWVASGRLRAELEPGWPGSTGRWVFDPDEVERLAEKLAA